ncbi:hypothetical protein PHPALM_28536, partial [Phytophthora palmivora]
MEVIVLDDSSDASSESELARASASTMPSTSPVPRRRAQSVGYANAVEAALAMAAALETSDDAVRSSKKKKEKKAAPAPPLLPMKNKKKHMQQLDKKLPQKSRPKEKNSHINSSRRPRYGAIGTDRPQQRRPSSKITDKRGEKKRLRGPSKKNKQQLKQRSTYSQQPVEVVDLLSSSSSDASSRRSSVSSLTSSDNESSTKTTLMNVKKRLVLNDRVLKRRKLYSTCSSGLHTKAGQSTTQTESHKASKMSVSVCTNKRKQVRPQVRRESTDSTKKRARAPGLQKKKYGVNGVGHAPRPRGFGSKSLTLTQNVSVSSSSSSDSSSPASSPRALPSRKFVPTPSSVSHQASQRREGVTDAFGRYHCRKSVSNSAKTPSRQVSSTSPSSGSVVSADSLSSPSPSPRKKRRAHSYFNTDHVALKDLQAQERELAWIQKQRQQTQNRFGHSKPATPKQKTCREVICVDDHSDASAAEEVKNTSNDRQHDKINVNASAAVVQRPPPVISYNAMLHPTSYRGIFFDEAPSNILLQRDIACSEPFESDCDLPLTFYDETDTLASYCSILETFGKPNQCISSVFPSEMVKAQSDVTRSVSSLVTAHLPIIRRCHQRKVQAILSEARQKISAYRAALNKHTKAHRGQNVMMPQSLCRSAAEKHAVKKLKAIQHTCSTNAQRVAFQIGRGDSFIREKTVSSLVQINRVEEIRSLRKYTTSVGLRANYRVEDDPILRYTANTRPSGAEGANGNSELAKKYGLRICNVADEEVTEYVLRLVVGRLGDSEQVFHALKSELSFSQGYTAYSELKKQDDSRRRARSRLDWVEKLGHDESRALDPDVSAIINLMKQSSISTTSRSKVLRRRLQPPIRTLESSIIDGLVENTTANMAALGLRGADSYNELVDVYSGSFCRMCYKYACHEHGGDHPLPTRRVDPIFPRVRVDNVVCVGNEVRSVDNAADFHHEACRDNRGSSVSKRTEVGAGSDVDMSDDSSASQQRRRHNAVHGADPSEFIDVSHVSVVATKMRSFLSTGNVCGKLCWKNDTHIGTKGQRSTLSPAERGVIRKLRETMGDNSCLLAAIVGSASCIDLHELITNEQVSNEPGGMGDVGRSGRRARHWKHGRRSGGSNHELLQRTRNQRLQDRGTENHEYQPCIHEGMCDSTGCSCMKRDHMCEKACACSRDCPNRFEGCSCSPGECRTSRCPCFAALRECDPDVCVSCGASELAVAVMLSLANTPLQDGTSIRPTCGNVNVIRSKHKQLGMSFSSIHGYGMYAREEIAADEFVYEYTGAMLSQDEAERRGLIYD